MEASTTSAVAGAFNSVGSLVSGFQQSSADRYNARVADQNAEIAQQQAQQKADAIRRDAVRLRGAQSAAAGASGVTQDSFADVMADSATEAELDALNAIYEGKMSARSYKSQGRAYRSSASDAISGGLVGAGANALSGYNNWKTAKLLEKLTIDDPITGKTGRTRIDQ